MNRPIKFRTWDSQKRTYRDLALAWNPHKEENYGIDGCEAHYSAEYGYVFEQFTGLKDKNGIEIYEGDIVKSSVVINRIVPDKGIFLVRWNCYLANWALDWNGEHNKKRFDGILYNGLKNPYHDWATDFAKLNGSKSPKLEVVGNIHQNPELLS